MGIRYTANVFPLLDQSEFRRVLGDVALACGRRIEWGTKADGELSICIGSAETVQNICLSDDMKHKMFMEKLSEALNAPCLELRIQEGVLWDYALFKGKEIIDLFSTLPQYWEYPNPLPRKEQVRWAGKPALVAELWKVPVDRIKRYYFNWGMKEDRSDSGVYDTLMKGKAYPEDDNPYGEVCQMFDFLRALGGVQPLECHRVLNTPN